MRAISNYTHNDLEPTADYPIRTAEIGRVSIIDVSLSAIIQFGDRGEFTPLLRALAVQRQEDHLVAGNVYFESYSIFNRPLPELIDPAAEGDEAITITRTNHSPSICVGQIKITAVGAASSMQAGNTMCTIAEARIKHIRQYKHSSMFPGIGC
ncbi:MAG: spore germination protein GerPE [Candidatus Pristimantibacillus sp.]